MSNNEKLNDIPSSNAPTYLELFNTVAALTERLQQLESATGTSQQSSEVVSPPAATSTVDYRILPDVGTSIWSFSGHESSAEAEDWISSVDGLAHVNQWPLRYRLLYVRSHVTEAARSWFLLEQFDDWNTFVKKFRATFVRKLRKADLWRELEARIQAPNEPSIDYFYSKIGLCRSLNLSFVETRDYVLEGLRSQQQAEWVSGRQQSDSDGLLLDIRDWERLRAKRQQLFTTTSAANLDKPSTYANGRTHANSSKQQPDISYKGIETSRTSDVSCYNCRGQGHISRDCPRPQRPMKCTGCGSNQHRRSKCPTSSAEQAAKGEAGQAYQVDTALSARKPNPFLKNVMLNDVSFTGLIDTGCSAVLVRRSAAAKCRLIVEPQVYPLYTVGNVDRPSVNAVGKAVANVTIDGVVANCHDVKIVDDVLIPVDVMVGRTWLELPHVNYYKQGYEMIFETNCHLDGKELTDEIHGDYPQVLMAECDANSTHVEPITDDDIEIGPELDSTCRKTLLTLCPTGTDWRNPHDVQAEARENITDAQPVPHLSTKLQPKYRVKPLQVVEVLPSDTYRVAEIAMDGHETYATTARHVSQLKSWEVLKEDDDDGDEDDVIREASDGEGRAEQSTSTLPVTKPRCSARTYRQLRYLDDYG